MRILTWNVNFRTAECLDGIHGLTPDVLLLQEVKHRTVDGIIARLRDDGLPNSTYSGSVSDQQKRYGNVIASRWPISPDTRGWARELRWPQLAHRATVHAPDGDLDAINVHIPNGHGNGWDKVYALEAVANAIARSADVRRVLAGDFNEPQTIRPDGTVISWGQLIGRDGSVCFGRRSNGGAGPGRFTDDEGRTHDLVRWHAAVTRIFDANGDTRLRHVQSAGSVTFDPLPVTHVVRGNNRFFDHMFVSKHLAVSAVQYVDSVREQTRYSDHSAVYADAH
jgi:endonuclease/exonuclease/phosphatase family metal-dependent hydrolase